MLLVECTMCGLIFNARFDAAAVPYDAGYENAQSHSLAFTKHLEEMAESWANKYELTGKTILEVGCGKGDFLRMICRRTGARGFGYDTALEGAHEESDPEVRFFNYYLTQENLPQHRPDLIVCRHVIEHVPVLETFFDLLHKLSTEANCAPVVIETPAWEWILHNNAFWDIVYEHSNYFGQSTLRLIAQRAGFEVCEQSLAFGGQYQVIELVPKSSSTAKGPDAPPPLSLEPFSQNMSASIAHVSSELALAGSGDGWAIWGGGAKGVTLADSILGPAPKFVIDVNPAKQGGFVPGAGIPIVAPTDARVGDVSVILVANSNYLNEIRQTLALEGLSPSLVTL